MLGNMIDGRTEPDRDERAEDEGLSVEPDVTLADADALDDAPDASAALHEAGGDADRAERLLEASIDSRTDEPLPDDERPV